MLSLSPNASPLYESMDDICENNVWLYAKSKKIGVDIHRARVKQIYTILIYNLLDTWKMKR